MDWATVPPWTTEHEQFLMKPSGRLNYLYNKWPRGKAITKLIMLSGNMISVQTHDSTVSVSEVKDLLKKTVWFDAGQSSGWRPRSNGHNTHITPIIS